MVIIKKGTLKEFFQSFPLATEPILRWYDLMKEADISDFSELKRLFPGVDSVGNGLYVFNIGGNKFRLIARIIFKVRTVFIRFIGTHQMYDKVKLSDL